jgi:hypothetical protein
MDRHVLLVLLLTATVAELLSAGAAATAVGENSAPTQHAHAIGGRKLLQPSTLGLPSITRASDSAGRVSERSINHAGHHELSASMPCTVNGVAALCAPDSTVDGD